MSYKPELRFQALNDSDLLTSPFEQFEKWWQLAQKEVALYPEHMILSTLDEDMYPQARVVLLRGFKPPYFQFFTNYKSQKSVHLLKHSKASLLFFWKELGKQIRVWGEVGACSEIESDTYWSTRPRESQIHAWASAQSSPVNSFDDLKAQVQMMEEQFKDQTTIPRPPHWGGWQLQAHAFEFWQEGEFRLHHRFRYTLDAQGQWQHIRLNP